MRHPGENWETQPDIFSKALSQPFLPPPSSAFLCLLHLCCNASSPPFRYTGLPGSPPSPSNPPPLLACYLTSFSFFACVPFILSLSLLPFLPLPPLAPCFEPGLESVHPEVCHCADGLISGWGNALRRAERGQGPGPGSSASTCCPQKDGRNRCSLDA